MGAVATPELLTHLFEEYKVRGEIRDKYEAFLLEHYGPMDSGPIKWRDNKLALEQEGVLDEILCLNCNDGKTMQMRAQWVIDNDKVTQCAELAGMWIAENAKTEKAVRS